MYGLVPPYSGTNYSVNIDGVWYETSIPAGTTITEGIKGYQSTGYDQCDIYGDAYNLPEGELNLSREDWAVLAETPVEQGRIW